MCAVLAHNLRIGHWLSDLQPSAYPSLFQTELSGFSYFNPARSC